MTVVVWSCTLICTEVTVRTTGAVGQMSAVVVFEKPVGVGKGMEELPVGNGGVTVVLKGTLGVADGTVVFKDAVEVVPTVLTVTLLPKDADKLPKKGGRIGVAVGEELVMALLEGIGRPEDDIRELVNDGKVVLAEGVMCVKMPELGEGPGEVELAE
jgi:hypothetical protein